MRITGKAASTPKASVSVRSATIWPATAPLIQEASMTTPKTENRRHRCSDDAPVREKAVVSSLTRCAPATARQPRGAMVPTFMT